MDNIVMNTYESKRLRLEKKKLAEEKSDILNSQLELQNLAEELLDVGTDLDKNNPLVKQLEARKDSLHNMETKLSEELERIKNRTNLTSEIMGEYK